MAGILLNRSRQVPAEQTPAFGGIAERFRRAGDLDRAIALCHEGLKRFPDQLSARVTLGWAFLDKGQYEEARAELEKVIRKAPDNLAAIRGLAELHDRSEGGMPSMDERESWRQQDEASAPAEAAESLALPSASPKAATFVDPFAPIAVTLASSTSTQSSPELVRTAEHAERAAEEAAASFDLLGTSLDQVVKVQLEDPAAASMAAAEVPASPTAALSPAPEASIAFEPERLEAASGAGSEAGPALLEETDLAGLFGPDIGDSFQVEAEAAFGSLPPLEVGEVPLVEQGTTPLASEWDLASETAGDSSEALDVFVAGASSLEGEDIDLGDVIKALGVDSPADMAPWAGPAEYGETADDTLAEFTESAALDLPVAATFAEFHARHERDFAEAEPAASVESLGSSDVDSALATLEADLEVGDEALADLTSHSAQSETALAPDSVGLVDDLGFGGEEESPDALVIATPDLSDGAKESAETTNGPFFELVPFEAAVEPAGAVEVEVEVEQAEEGRDGLMADLFANLPEELDEPQAPAHEEPDRGVAASSASDFDSDTERVVHAEARDAAEVEASHVVEPEEAALEPVAAMVDADPVGAAMTPVFFEVAAEAGGPALQVVEPSNDNPFAGMVAIEAQTEVPDYGSPAVPAAASATPIVEVHQPAEVVQLGRRRAGPKAPVAALERFLRQVKTRGAQLRSETVA